MSAIVLIDWSFKIIDFAKNNSEFITQIRVYKSEKLHFGKKYYRINFEVMDYIPYTLKTSGYENIWTENTDRINEVALAKNKITQYHSFYSKNYCEEVVNAHYDWVIEVLDSLISAQKLNLKLIRSNKYDLVTE